MSSYRLSLGDFELDPFTNQRDKLIGFSWALWMIGVFILNVMFMNFIIAVISESYEKVMQRLVALSFMLKAEMIVERESMMTEDDKNNLEYFPKYLILRRAVGSGTDSSEEWQGFIKDIKQTLKITQQKNEISMMNQIQTLRSSFNTLEAQNNQIALDSKLQTTKLEKVEN